MKEGESSEEKGDVLLMSEDETECDRPIQNNQFWVTKGIVNAGYPWGLTEDDAIKQIKQLLSVCVSVIGFRLYGQSSRRSRDAQPTVATHHVRCILSHREISVSWLFRLRVEDVIDLYTRLSLEHK